MGLCWNLKETEFNAQWKVLLVHCEKVCFSSVKNNKTPKRE